MSSRVGTKVVGGIDVSILLMIAWTIPYLWLARKAGSCPNCHKYVSGCFSRGFWKCKSCPSCGIKLIPDRKER